MRQTGVCHKNHGPQDSTWIILQPSPEVIDRLKLIMSGPDFITVYEQDPMSLHLIFLDFQSVNWDDFIEELRISLEPLVSSLDYENHCEKLTSVRLRQLITLESAVPANTPSQITL